MSKRKNPAAAVQDELENLVDDLVDMARSSTGLDAGKIEEIKQGFRERVEKVRVEATQAAQSIADHADEAIERADSYAHEKPWHLVLAAGLVGLALGVLVSRR